MWDVTKGYIKMLEDTLDPVDPVPVIGNIKQTDDYCHKLPPDVENYNESKYNIYVCIASKLYSSL